MAPGTSQSDAASSQSQSQPRKSRAKTKTFSGCWTCRSKHVKCDEAKPDCNRCRQAGISCEGYGIRLCWNSRRNLGTTPSRTPSTRKAARRAKSKLLHADPRDDIQEATSRRDESPKQVNQLLGEAEPGRNKTPIADGQHVEDEARAERVTEQSEHVLPYDQTSSSLPELEEPREEGLSTRLDQSYTLLGQGLSGRVTGNSLYQQQVPAHLDSFDRGFSDQRGPSTTITHSFNTSLPLAGFGDATEASNLSAAAAHLQRSDPARREQPDVQRGWAIANSKRHVDLLENPALQSKLMEHWTMHLCDALSPVPGLNNPLRSIMTPIALEGCRTDSRQSTGATALFHLICSASSFHLSKTVGLPEKKSLFENVALEHHNLGIAHLAQNIQSDDRSQCVALLAALIMCLLHEAVTLPTKFWRLHLRGAVEWVNHVEPHIWHQSEAASTCYQMFIGMATLVQAQLLLDGPDVALDDIPYNSESQAKPYALHTIFGLPQPLFEGILKMNTYSLRHKPTHDASEQAKAQSFEMLDRLEIELYLSVPPKPKVADSEDGNLIYHHGCTFYFAALVHMKRTLRGVPVSQVQALVEQALHHMEMLQTCTNNGRPFCPMIWPIAMVAFEASETSLQNRTLKCIDFFSERSRLAIWEQVRVLIKDLWVLRKTPEGINVKWYETVLGHVSDSFMLL